MKRTCGNFKNISSTANTSGYFKACIRQQQQSVVHTVSLLLEFAVIQNSPVFLKFVVVIMNNWGSLSGNLTTKSSRIQW